MVLLHFQVGLHIYVFPKRTSLEWGGLLRVGGPKIFASLLLVNNLNGRQQAGLHLSSSTKGKFLKFLTWLVENIWSYMDIHFVV